MQMKRVRRAMEERKHAAGLFIDLKKAFDALDHSVLLRKLELFGLRGVTLRWMQS